MLFCDAGISSLDLAYGARLARLRSGLVCPFQAQNGLYALEAGAAHHVLCGCLMAWAASKQSMQFAGQLACRMEHALAGLCPLATPPEALDLVCPARAAGIMLVFRLLKLPLAEGFPSG
jgi:hypothetical protein